MEPSLTGPDWGQFQMLFWEEQTGFVVIYQILGPRTILSFFLARYSTAHPFLLVTWALLQHVITSKESVATQALLL